MKATFVNTKVFLQYCARGGEVVHLIFRYGTAGGATYSDRQTYVICVELE